MQRQTRSGIGILGFLAVVVGATPVPAGAISKAPSGARADSAATLMDRAIDLMGGDSLRDIRTVRFEMMTQWQAIDFDERPYTGRVDYEHHTDERDYGIPAWRNTRRFLGSGREVVDVVRGDAAARDFGQGFQPLNIAYVDERRQLFAYTPDQLVLGLRNASDLEQLADTTLGGMLHARVAGTVGGYAMTLHIRRADGLPAMVSFRAAEPNDYGLVPWGQMNVEVWYSRWRSFPNGVSLPAQWDIRRVGATYKRITVLKAEFNPELEPGLIAIADDVRAAYEATATRPMHDLPLDSASLEGRFARFGAFGSPAAAVRLGGDWLLLETGQAPLSLDRSLDWLERNADGRVVAAVATAPQQGNGGAAALAARDVPLLAGPGVKAFVDAVLAGHDVREGFTTVTEGQWIAADGDSAWVEPIDLPNARGALLVYVPSMRWLYSAPAVQPLDEELVLERAREKGWAVERIGNARDVDRPVQ